MKWYIGQKVVALKTITSSWGDVGIEKGKGYMVQGIKKSKCCGHILLDVGISTDIFMTVCCGCKRIYSDDGTWFFLETRFAPLEEGTETTELSEVLVSPNGDILEPQTA